MKTLVVYYSKTGNTKKIAEEILKVIKADRDEIVDLKNRKGLINWLISGRDGMKKRLTKIKYSKNPARYDLVVIGTPVWGWNVVPAVRTYLTENKPKKISFFSTSGGTNVKQTFLDMESISKKPIAFLSITEKEIKSNNYHDKLKEFCNKLKKV
jgi:flavodoxin